MGTKKGGGVAQATDTGSTLSKKLADPAALEDLKKRVQKRLKEAKRSVRVCIGTGCAAKGSRRIYELFCEAAKQAGSDVKIEAKCVGCHGFCERGPIVVVEPGEVLYQRVEEPDVEEIFRETVLGGRVIDRLLYKDLSSGKSAVTAEKIPFYHAQRRIVLALNGQIDPTSIED